MSRIMAIDYGDAKIGIALSDPLQIIASGFSTLKNTPLVFDEIIKICKEKAVINIVIGIPFNQNSEIGPSAQKVLIFIQKLINELEQNKLNLPIYEQDERYTTREAFDTIKEMNVKRKKRRAVIDQVAAAKILSAFMNSNNKILLNLAAYNDTNQTL